MPRNISTFGALLLGACPVAIEDPNRTIELKPDFALAFRRRGMSEQKLGQPERAVADFDAAMRLDGRDTVALKELAWLLATSAQPQRREGKPYRAP